MKKYIAPEVEIKRFAVESIMEGSEVELTVEKGDISSANVSDTVTYNALFGL